MKPIFRPIALVAVFALLTVALSACKKQNVPESDVTSTSKTLTSGATDLTNPERAFALYETAKSKQATAGGVDATLTGTAVIRNDKGETDWTIDVHWLSRQPSSNPLDYVDHLTESIVKGNDVTERDVFYGNGTLYTTQGNKKFRQLVDRGTAIGETALFTLPEMTKAAFAEPQIGYENGNTRLSLSLNGDILSDELLAENGSLVYLLGGLNEEAEYTFGDTGVTLEIDEIGCFARYAVYYTVQLNDDANTFADVHLSITYDNTAKEINVKLPNEKEYKERIGSGLSKEAYAVMTDVVDLLFGADGERVESFDEAYESACKQYKKSIVDEIVEWFEEQ